MSDTPPVGETRAWLLHPRQRWQQRRRRSEQLREFVDYARERDPVENADSTPPASEEVRLHAVWIAESYPPSFFEALVDAVRRLTVESRRPGGAPPAEQLEAALRSGRSGWLPLAPIVSPGSPLYALASPIKVGLPAGVEYGHASLHYLVPSHAALVVCFVLDETASKEVEDALRAAYESYATKRGGWTTIHSPANQKREAVRARRAKQLDDLSTFFQREAPGLFTDGRHVLPSIEFWTTKERTPFDEEGKLRGRESLHDFIQLLGWIAWADVWRGPYNLTLKEASLGADGLWSHAPNLQVAACEAELFPGENLDMYGGRSREGYVNHLRDSLDPLVAALALTETFRFYEEELVASRQRLREAQRRSLRRRVKATVAVQDRLLRHHADVDAVARGVTRWKDDLLPVLRFNTIDFERWLPPSLRDADSAEPPEGKRSRLRRLIRRPRKRDTGAEEKRRPRPPRESWLEAQAREILERAAHVVGGSREISDVVRTISETTNAQANLRLQLQVAILTWVLAAIGIATLIVVATAD